MAATYADRAVLELHVGEMKQLFNAMDPAPFRERDPKAEQFFVVKPHVGERQPRALHALHFPFDAVHFDGWLALGNPQAKC